MNKLATRILKDFEYNLNTYKVCQNNRKKNILMVPSFIIFGLILVLYFFQETLFNQQIFDFVVVLFAVFAFVIIPLSFKKGNRFEMVLITPDCLIQRKSRKDIVLIPYDKIKKFRIDDNKNVNLENGDFVITLNPSLLGSDLATIIEILEAKGKTFDKTKDFMIRPIVIEIVDGNVTILDQKHEETETERLVGVYAKQYPMLTPGFLDRIIIMNSVVERALKVDENLVIKLNVMEVKEGHPENTKFMSQLAKDCILIFEKVDIETVIRKDAENKEVPKEIKISLATLAKQLSKSVISDWRLEHGVIYMQFSVGVSILQVTMGYKEVIVGWKSFK